MKEGVSQKAKNKKSRENNVQWLALLKGGDLISKIILTKNVAQIILHPQYDTQEYYLKINKSLNDLYLNNKNFRELFKKPSLLSKSLTTLTMLGSKQYESGEALLNDLKSIAARKPIQKKISEPVHLKADSKKIKNETPNEKKILLFTYPKNQSSRNLRPDIGTVPLEPLFEGKIEEWLKEPVKNIFDNDIFTPAFTLKK